jgi:hypothetical protein
MHHAHRWLAALYRQELNDPDKAAFHHEQSQRLLAEHQKRQTLKLSRVSETFDLPPIPSADERREMLDKERPPKKQELGEKSGKTFVLVSGLPRSGTSLMMQMLRAGGMQIMTDGQRAADEDNPRGYYEWEALKQIQKEPELLDEDGLEEKAIKAISMLLPKMPKKHDYKVIFMTRPVEEVVASQANMIERLGTEGAQLGPEQLTRGLLAHRNQILAWLAKADHMEVLEVDYPSLVESPAEFVPKIAQLIGADRVPDAQAMLSVVDPKLHRQKAAAAAEHE